MRGDEDAEPAPRRGHRLPDDWTPSDDLRAWAAEQFPWLDVSTATEAFRDYWTAKTGKDATKLDWAATWKNWIRRDADRAPAWKRNPRPRVVGGTEWEQ